MCVMAKHKPVVWMRIDIVREEVLGVLDQRGGIIGIVECVEAVVDNVIPETSKFRKLIDSGVSICHFRKCIESEEN